MYPSCLKDTNLLELVRHSKKDYDNSHLVFVSAFATLEAAVQKLKDNNIHSAPVCAGLILRDMKRKEQQ